MSFQPPVAIVRVGPQVDSFISTSCKDEAVAASELLTHHRARKSLVTITSMVPNCCVNVDDKDGASPM